MWDLRLPDILSNAFIVVRQNASHSQLSCLDFVSARSSHKLDHPSNLEIHQNDLLLDVHSNFPPFEVVAVQRVRWSHCERPLLHLDDRCYSSIHGPSCWTDCSANSSRSTADQKPHDFSTDRHNEPYPRRIDRSITHRWCQQTTASTRTEAWGHCGVFTGAAYVKG